jgi:CHAT domain-containing protein
MASNPLIRSGLVMAGANRVWLGQKPFADFEDGILTAYEISLMNLSNTKLVVLSACETGLGDIEGSEGVFGLQRAFKMAGVPYTMMSLWSVPDEQTAELMIQFYTYLIDNQFITTAFSNAQRAMQKKYPPYYWAGFVLVR